MDHKIDDVKFSGHRYQGKRTWCLVSCIAHAPSIRFCQSLASAAVTQATDRSWLHHFRHLAVHFDDVRYGSRPATPSVTSSTGIGIVLKPLTTTAGASQAINRRDVLLRQLKDISGPSKLHYATALSSRVSKNPSRSEQVAIMCLA